MAEIAQNIEEMEQDSVVQEPDSQTTEEVQVQETKEEEQNPRIAELEKQFENRYTESDPAFKAVVESKEASPPVVQNFGSHGYVSFLSSPIKGPSKSQNYLICIYLPSF